MTHKRLSPMACHFLLTQNILTKDNDYPTSINDYPQRKHRDSVRHSQTQRQKLDPPLDRANFQAKSEGNTQIKWKTS